jgi:hypothetical protein
MAIINNNTSTLNKIGYIFDKWNTQIDGLGTNYLGNEEINIECQGHALQELRSDNKRCTG